MEIFGYKFVDYKTENGIKYYKYEDKNIILTIAILDIGALHPFIENVSSTNWYNSEYGGCYINGFDKNRQDYFLPYF